MKNFYVIFIFALLMALISSASATVIVKDTFEPGQANSVSDPNYNSGCVRSSFWSPSDYPKSRGGDGAEIGGIINNVTPHNGSCYAYYHYTHDESSAYLGSDVVASKWSSTTARAWHSVYWIYIDSQHSSPAPFSHPIHQKLGKWFLKPSFSGAGVGAGSDCNFTSNACAIPNIGHVRGISAGDESIPMKWESSMEQYGDASDPSYYCSTGVMGSGSVLTYNTWHKVEAYTNLRGGCVNPSANQNACMGGTTPYAACAASGDACPGGGVCRTNYMNCKGCADQHRVWIDDQLIIGHDDLMMDYTGSRVLANFNFFGNASATGAPVDWWIYADNICVGTSYNDCTESEFGGTKAQAEFGSGDHTPPAAPRNVRVL